MIAKNKTIPICSKLLLLLFLSYQCLTVTYTHIHQVGDNIIFHVHPFTKSTEDQHSHTLYEMANIDLLVYHFAIIVFALILKIDTNIISLTVAFINRLHPKIIFAISSNRGPPICL